MAPNNISSLRRFFITIFPLYNTPNLYYPKRATAAWMGTREITGSVLHEAVKESSPFAEKAGIKPGP
ncbi:hypothetical protein GCM10022398_32060 [Acetobacter lovaniensis]